MAQIFQTAIRCSDPLPALLRWADGFKHAAFLITSRTNFSGGVGTKRAIEIRLEADSQDKSATNITRVSKSVDYPNATKVEMTSEAQGAFKHLEKFQKECEGRIFGFMGYDLKNDLEDLHSHNPDILESPEAAFFEPALELTYAPGELKLKSTDKTLLAEAEAALTSGNADEFLNSGSLNLSARNSRKAYLEKAQSIRDHLQRGDIYEANYCMQFAGAAENFDPVAHFIKLQELTEAPFSVFSKLNDFYTLSASPERYLKNESGHLTSQPIKGTLKRAQSPEADEAQKVKLRQDPKEQNENVMIVDLVRNDLSRVARRNSVRVETLFGVETFKTVHHLVSTILADLDTNKYSSWDALRATFPMGSMTGAPKISAMQIIDSHESFKRSAYSGAFGWMDPAGDFDFNVLIRSVFYNATNQKAAFGVGSALTIMADIEKEYEECLLKAGALLQTFNCSPAHEPA